MALLYFPKDSNLGLRNAWDPSYQELIISCNPNMVLYFDTGSTINAASSSMLYITSSWALTSSVTILYASNSLSASYADTSSFALNAAAGGSGGPTTNSSSYTTIVSSSTNWITASFGNVEQYVSFVSSALYNFTCSNVAVAGTMSYTTLYISNTATATCSLAFPSTWVFMGYVPTSLSSSRSAVLSLRNYGGNPIVAAFAVQY